MAARNYSSVAPEMILQSSVNSSATTFSVDTVTGLPAAPFTLIVDPGEAGEEIVTCTAIGGLNLTVVRGENGTAAASHGNGAKLRHGVSARDFQEANDHVNDVNGGVHGVVGALVGTTDTQTLDHKTFMSSDATGAPLTVQAASSQSDAILDFKSSGGSSVASVMPSGRVVTPGIDGSSQSIFTAGAAGTIPLIAKGAASQTADLLTGRTSASVDVFRVNASGRVLGPGMDATADAAGSTPVKVKGAASQTADLFLVVTNGDAQLVAITSAGRIEAVGLDAGASILTPVATGDVPLTIKNIGSQTGNPLEFRSSANALLAKVDTAGAATFTSVTETAPVAWSTYTPTISGASSGGSNGNATSTGRYRQIGTTVHVMIDFIFGSSTSTGTGFLLLTLPVAARSTSPHAIGSGSAFDDSANNRRTLIPNLHSTTSFWCQVDSSIADSFTPWNWGTNDHIRVNLTYEAA